MIGTVKLGSKGFDVAVVQLLLNMKLAPSTKVSVDGDFGPRTRQAAVAFQRRSALAADGIVGPKTYAALSNGARIRSKNHGMALIPQPTNTTCWAASTAMMTRSTVAAVVAKTPTDMLASDGGLLNSSESDQAVVSGAKYGRIHGLKCHPPMSWSVAAFVSEIERSPLMIDTLWNSTDYVQGNGSPGHMVVVSAVVSDNNPVGNGTHLLTLDPWRPNQGKYHWVEYQKWVNDVPTRTYRVFTR